MSLRHALVELYGHIGRRRKKQVLLLGLLTLAGAVAELFTLGAVVPFISVLADPEKAFEYPRLQSLFAGLGWQRPADILLPATLLFIGMAVVSAGVRLLLNFVNIKFAFSLGYDLSVEVYRRILYQPYSYHTSHNTSDIIAGTQKVQAVISGAVMPLLQGVSSTVIGLFIVFALLAIDPVIAASAAIGFGFVYLLVSYIFRRRVRENSRIIARMQSRRIKEVQEGLGGIRDVLLDDAQPQYVQRFRGFDYALKKAQAHNSFIGTAPRFVVESLGVMLIAALAFVLTTRSEGGGLAGMMPVLGALALGAQRLLPLFQIIYASWTKLSGSYGVIFDVLGLLNRPVPKEYSREHHVPELGFLEEIAARRLGFHYPSSTTPILENVNLAIKKGDKVGFLGATGSGKSTLLDVLMGLLEPTEGQLTVDGEILNRQTRRAWQKHIAHVPQSIFLSDATIAENIAFGADLKSIDHQRLEDAARRAHILEFIQQQPEGFETTVGERGIRLSGGQRQRIGIARALYKHSSVLVLDEATSALDENTEAAVVAAINKLGDNPTVLIVAHRLSTLRHCDYVVELSKGRVINSGSYDEVIGAPRRIQVPSE
ncbi:MAG: ABC transporter ATP-binding protein [Salinisphaeraceae bacterium]|nr:ABC transporter ATP-binding protein [Salinisphaeraceae bacterium]